MNYFSTWNDAIRVSLQNLWIKFINFVPELIGGLVVLIFGLWLASWLGGVAQKLLHKIHLDTLAEKAKLSVVFAKAGLEFHFSALVGWIVKWFFNLVVLITVADILGWEQINVFLRDIALYLPRVFVSVIIITIGMIAAHFIGEVVKKGIQATNLPQTSAHSLAVLSRWSVIVFSLMAGLIQLGIAPDLIRILFTGFVFMVSLAFGLAFGLGGKDHAAKWLSKVDRDFSGKQK